MTKSEAWAHDIRREIIEASHDDKTLGQVPVSQK